jgi:hypothetical protein
MSQWLVQLVGNEPGNEGAWTFNSLKDAENFIKDRRNLLQHLKYDPDNSYYILPIE